MKTKNYYFLLQAGAINYVPKVNFQSSFDIGDFVKFKKRKTSKKPKKGWILEVRFSESYIFYTIQEEANEKGNSWIHESIEDNQIICETECI